MTMTPRLSKFVLTSHITFSVGWLGAVAVFLALAITGLTSQNSQLARSAYLAMELSAWFIIVPFCLASLLTGLVQALGTRWGLFKYYWIVVKLFLTITATIVLLLHMQPIGYLAGLAEDTSFTNTQEYRLRIQLIADAGAAILVLLATTTISVYKPWGKIQYGLGDTNKNIPTQGQKAISKKVMGFLHTHWTYNFGCNFYHHAPVWRWNEKTLSITQTAKKRKLYPLTVPNRKQGVVLRNIGR